MILYLRLKRDYLILRAQHVRKDERYRGMSTALHSRGENRQSNGRRGRGRVVKCYRCQDMAFVLGECLGFVELARLAEYYKLHK